MYSTVLIEVNLIKTSRFKIIECISSKHHVIRFLTFFYKGRIKHYDNI
jgi:hypothetical protein